MPVTVAMPGSCGELVQGMIDGVIFHVTCPVDIYSRVTVDIRNNGNRSLECPADRPKARLALEKALAHWRNGHAGARMCIDSPLPLSKGMASSTADVAAAIAAAGAALGQTAEFELISRIAVSIEPSDGTFFPGIVAFDHREGKMMAPLGAPPPIDIAIFDCGGEVDTVAFNSIDRRAVLKRHEPEVREALAAVREGVARGDVALIGFGATLSARANQDILLKPQLEKTIILATEAGAAGVNVGHSGTVIGVLMDPRKTDGKAITSYLRRKLEGMNLLFETTLIGGGGKVI